jgi:hypothetical protein
MQVSSSGGYAGHLPRAAGTNPNGQQNNWWKYLYNPLAQITGQ